MPAKIIPRALASRSRTPFDPEQDLTPAETEQLTRDIWGGTLSLFGNKNKAVVVVYARQASVFTEARFA
jgi:hypothetical protein